MFTEHKDSHKQSCPRCSKKLETIKDYIGGGSHYWVLNCKECDVTYTYDTYRFKLNMLETKSI